MNATDTTARSPFTGDAPVWIDFPGAIGRKPGHVVNDDGGVKIEVRYEKKGGEVFKEVAAHQVTAREADEPTDAPAEPAADEPQDEKPKAKKASKSEGPARPKKTELLAYAQDFVIAQGPTAILADGIGSPVRSFKTEAGDNVHLTDDEMADLDRMARYQAGRVLIFFGREAPEGHKDRRH